MSVILELGRLTGLKEDAIDTRVHLPQACGQVCAAGVTQCGPRGPPQSPVLPADSKQKQ